MKREFNKVNPEIEYNLLIRVSDLLAVASSACFEHDCIEKLTEIQMLYQSLMYKVLAVHYCGVLNTVKYMKFIKKGLSDNEVR